MQFGAENLENVGGNLLRRHPHHFARQKARGLLELNEILPTFHRRREPSARALGMGYALKRKDRDARRIALLVQSLTLETRRDNGFARARAANHHVVARDFYRRVNLERARTQQHGAALVAQRIDGFLNGGAIVFAVIGQGAERFGARGDGDGRNATGHSGAREIGHDQTVWPDRIGGRQSGGRERHGFIETGSGRLGLRATGATECKERQKPERMFSHGNLG